MKKIILDTDLGSDCDDSGALSIIHNLHSEGKCELLGVLCSIANKYCPITVKAINTWFQNKDIPIGQTNTHLFENTPENMIFTKIIATEYLKNNDKPHIHDAVRLYRQILRDNSDITIISIGFLNNISALLNSVADDISPLSGVELIKEKVKKVYLMGGNFSGNEKQPEYNIYVDIDSSKNVALKMPVPIIYIGWEAGINILTGHTLWNFDNNSPIKKSYELFAKHYNCLNKYGTYDRHSWDPLTAYYAITEDSSVATESEFCTINFDDNGFTIVNPGGKDKFLIPDTKRAKEIIEKYISLYK